MTFKSDIEIAQEAKPLHIREIGKKLYKRCDFVHKLCLKISFFIDCYGE